MKYLAALLLLAVSAVALADPHWVEITTSSANKVYIDDSNVVVETLNGHTFNGFKALIVFDHAAVFNGTGLTTPYNVTSETLNMMYDCHAQVGIAKRLAFIDDQKIEHPIEDVYRVIDRAPATDILLAVQSRVCFRIST